MNEGPLGTLLRERFFGDKSHPVTDYIYPAKNTKNVNILFGSNILFSVTDSLVIANIYILPWLPWEYVNASR